LIIDSTGMGVGIIIGGGGVLFSYYQPATPVQPPIPAAPGGGRST
jgi:hypothetical protein